MNFNTQRLILNELRPADTGFIIELLNSPGWIKFIGDRKIKTDEDALAYIEKVTGSEQFKYWVARSKEDNTPLGVITFIKRDYLQQHDIGFAFLPQHNGKGYAYEAANAVLMHQLNNGHSSIQATTLEDNTSSIQLLTRLGFSYTDTIQVENEKLLLYSIHTPS